MQPKGDAREGEMGKAREKRAWDRGLSYLSMSGHSSRRQDKLTWNPRMLTLAGAELRVPSRLEKDLTLVSCSSALKSPASFSVTRLSRCKATKLNDALSHEVANDGQSFCRGAPPCHGM